MVKSIARSLIAGIALMALAERADAIEPSIADIQRALAFDEVMLRARAGQLEDEWRGSVGPATARQWRDYLDRLPPGLAGAFAA